jgi:hypothetical protein
MATLITYTPENAHYQPPEVKIINGQPVRFRDVCVHEFRMTDVEDSDIMAGEPIWQWQNSDQGKWIMEQATEKPYWIRAIDHVTFGYRYRIMARLNEQMECFWRLRWGGLNK